MSISSSSRRFGSDRTFIVPASERKGSAERALGAARGRWFNIHRTYLAAPHAEVSDRPVLAGTDGLPAGRPAPVGPSGTLGAGWDNSSARTASGGRTGGIRPA